MSNETETKQRRCRALVYRDHAWWPACCRKKAVTEAGYCRQHDPVHRSARRALRPPIKSQQGWDARRRLAEILDELAILTQADPVAAALVREAKDLRIKLPW